MFLAKWPLVLLFSIAALCPPAAGLAASSKRASAATAADARRALLRLKAAVVSRDAGAVEARAVDLARAGGARSMRSLLALIQRIPASEDGLYWSLIAGAASFVDGPALEILGKTIGKYSSRPLGRDLLYALAQNASPRSVAALRPVALDGPQGVRRLAISKIAHMHLPEAMDVLIEVLKKEEKAGRGKATPLTWAAVDGLEAMTGQSFGPVAVNWEGWWRKNRDKPLRPVGQGDGVEVVSGTGTVVDSLRRDRSRRDRFFGMEKAPQEAVVVLSAVYTRKTQRDLNNDHMEYILDRMKIPHVVVNREDFASYNLAKAGAVLINCTQFHEFCICPHCKPGGTKSKRLYKCTGCDKHIPFSAKLKDPAIKKLADFVRSGGYLFCEDWVVREVVERAFAKYAAAGGDLKEDAVDVVPARGMGTHPYLRGIFTPRAVGPGSRPGFGGGDDLWGEDDPDLGPPENSPQARSGKTVVLGPDGLEIGVERIKVKHTWTIDDESYALKIVDRARVLPLLTSGKLQKITGGDGTVALAFRAGSSLPPGRVGGAGTPGVVAVVLSHFGKQASTEDEYTIQNLLLNFLLDAEDARRARFGRRR